MYPSNLVIPMKQELTSNGFKDITASAEVEKEVNVKGTTLVMVNSVCGCAAGAARPGVIQSLSGSIKPSNLITVFAGFDTEAVNKARELMMPFPPSSPCIALFKDGELVHMLERNHIEGNSASIISENLKAAYEEFC